VLSSHPSLTHLVLFYAFIMLFACPIYLLFPSKEELSARDYLVLTFSSIFTHGIPIYSETSCSVKAPDCFHNVSTPDLYLFPDTVPLLPFLPYYFTHFSYHLPTFLIMTTHITRSFRRSLAGRPSTSRRLARGRPPTASSTSWFPSSFSSTPSSCASCCSTWCSRSSWIGSPTPRPTKGCFRPTTSSM
jgi:hypothetical protein